MSNNFGGNRIPDTTFCKTEIDARGNTIFTAYTCTQLTNSTVASVDVVVNGQTVSIPAFESIPYQVHSVGTWLTGVCMNCYCFNCGHPDRNAPRVNPMSAGTRAQQVGYVKLGMSGLNN
tara:strand:- start:599 stop:955 length:357 start_codon:yes stop_codon:yes gene_type:complete